MKELPVRLIAALKLYQKNKKALQRHQNYDFTIRETLLAPIQRREAERGSGGMLLKQFSKNARQITHVGEFSATNYLYLRFVLSRINSLCLPCT